MQDFLKALANFSAAQLVTSLAVLAPFVAGIWVALKWAYDTRLKNLETSLSDLRGDFDRKLSRELQTAKDVHDKLAAQLQEEKRLAQLRAESFESELHERKRHQEELDESVRIRTDEIAAAENRLIARLEAGNLRTEITLVYISYLCASPQLIFKTTFTQVQIEDIRTAAEDGYLSAMYVYGRMLETGRLLDDGMLSPDKDRGLALIRLAAEKGHSAAKAYSSGAAA